MLNEARDLHQCSYFLFALNEKQSWTFEQNIDVSVIKRLSFDACFLINIYICFLTFIKVAPIVSRCVDQLLKKLKETNLDEPVDLKQYDVHVIFPKSVGKKSPISFNISQSVWFCLFQSVGSLQFGCYDQRVFQHQGRFHQQSRWSSCSASQEDHKLQAFTFACCLYVLRRVRHTQK